MNAVTELFQELCMIRQVKHLVGKHCGDRLTDDPIDVRKDREPTDYRFERVRT